ncbi:hypothetical protein [Pseudomonas sp. Leaf48]|uniref:hypothetical protein n=1 Tax=Pseudomonas sp. Leaf48 TaxID=1736221 RepID=UPI0012E85A15|nr:hypothetical protein [Pseudomonas sp. Leaf48]
MRAILIGEPAATPRLVYRQWLLLPLRQQDHGPFFIAGNEALCGRTFQIWVWTQP